MTSQYASTVIAIVWWVSLACCLSVTHDFFTYTKRQTEWEQAHPGATYVRGYGRMMRKAERANRRARNAGGQL